MQDWWPQQPQAGRDSDEYAQVHPCHGADPPSRAPKRIPQLERRLHRLATEFAAMDAGGGLPYNLSLALYPSEVSMGPAPSDPAIVIGRPQKPPG